MNHRLFRATATLVVGIAMAVAPKSARADEPSTPRTVEVYEERLAEQESLARRSHGPAGAGERARLAKLRAEYERDTRSYSLPTTVAGGVLVGLGTGGVLFGLGVEAVGGSSRETSGLGMLLFALPSLLGGLIPGVIMVTVGSRTVMRKEASSTGSLITLKVAPGGFAGTF